MNDLLLFLANELLLYEKATCWLDPMCASMPPALQKLHPIDGVDQSPEVSFLDWKFFRRPVTGHLRIGAALDGRTF
jgi:hypothetical protein